MGKKEVAAVRFDRKHPFVTALAVFAAALVGIYLFSLQDNNLTQEQITALVENNTQSILAIAQSETPEAMPRPQGVRKITVVEGTVDFYCGGSGVGADAAHYGFYRRADGGPDAVYCGTRFGPADRLQPEGDGFVLRREDKTYYTRHITGGFYYYEVHL